MSDKVELHGWTDLSLPSEAMLELSSRAFKLMAYYVFRQRMKNSCVPGIRRIADDLTTEDEKWSDGTIKRANAELVAKKWIVRNRRVGSSSETHVFHSPSLCEEWLRQITGDLTIGSPAIPQPDHGRSQIRKTKGKEDEGESGAAADKPKPKRPQNLVFNAVAKGSFGITEIALLGDDGGRVGKISGWLHKTEPKIDPSRVEAFYEWYGRNYPDVAAPRDIHKFQEHWAVFAQGGSAADVVPAYTDYGKAKLAERKGL